MHPFSTVRIPETIWDVLRFAIAWWLFNFVLVLLPLDLLFRLQSLLDAGSALQVGLDCAFMVLFFTVFSMLIAMAVTFLCLPFRFLFKKLFSRIAFAVNVGCGIVFLSTNVFHYSIRWVEKIFHLTNIEWASPVESGFLIVVSLAVAIYCIFFLFKTSGYAKLLRFSSSSFKFTSVLTVLCLTVVVSHVAYAQFEHSDETILSERDKKNVSKDLPNIVIVTFDALRASEMSLYGFNLETTPNIDKLGASSYVFDNMYSACNWTVPSLSSLLTGKYPFSHNVNGVGYSIFRGKDKDENIAFALKQLGYNTGTLVANNLFVPSKVQINGFDEVVEFDPPSSFLRAVQEIVQKLEFSTVWIYDLAKESPLADPVLGLSTKATMERFYEFSNARVNFKMAREIMDSLKPPFFFWIHVTPPHMPYLSEKEFLYKFLPEHGVLDSLKDFDEVNNVMFPQRRYSREFQSFVDKLELRYDEHVRFVDSLFGDFLDGLKADGLLDNTMLVVSADHGESFQRGVLMHGGPDLYQELIHVPLIVKMPGQTEGKRIKTAVSNVDIAPTMLSILGVPAPNWMEGQSLTGIMAGEILPEKPKLAMNFSLMDSSFDFMSKSIAVIKDKYKLICYISYDKCELYNIEEDSGETVNLVDKEKEIYAAMKGELLRVLKDKPVS